MNDIHRMSQTHGTPSYYMPYTSEDDTDVSDYETDDETDETDKSSQHRSDHTTDNTTDNTSDNTSQHSDVNDKPVPKQGRGMDFSNVPDSEDIRIRREQDPRYALLRTPGYSQKISETQLKFMDHSQGQLQGAPWDESTDVKSFEDHVYLNPPKVIKTSLISIKSINRDKNVHPTPFNFQLKLPRTYKNITKFQIVQLSFPNSSNGVTAPNIYLSSLIQKLLNDGVPSTCIVSCINIINCTTASNTVGMMEAARLNSAGYPLLTTLSVPPATYSDTQLAQELTAQANNTPPMNLISYPQFSEVFINTRDASVLFNEPGDCFFSRTNNLRYASHTKEHIMNTYYTQQHINQFPTITEQIAFTAYYYPILKEAVATELAEPFIQLPPTITDTWDTVKTRILGAFEGLDSDFYYKICIENQSALDIYRRHLTFELRNINKYRWTFANNRFITYHDTMHTSITRDIAKSMNNALQQELVVAGLSINSFNTLKTNAVGYNAIAKHMELNLSTHLGQYHFATGYRYCGGSTHVTVESTFTTEDLVGDPEFTSMFSYTSTFGRIYGNYAGLKMSFTNFTDYHSTLSSYYAISQSTNQSIYAIHSSSQGEYHSYVSTKYSGILPMSMISTKSYVTNQGAPVSFVTGMAMYVPGMNMTTGTTSLRPTDDSAISATSAISETSETSETNLVIDPTVSTVSTLSTVSTVSTTTLSDHMAYKVSDKTYNGDCGQICCDYLSRMISSWYSGLPTNLVIGTLTYRLGLTNVVPNTFNILSTISLFTSTTNMNFFMQINDEQGFNNLDITMNENYAITNDTTGQVKLMAAKILMGNVGDTGISQTLIQNPAVFENTLGKLDRLNIKIYYDDESLTPAWSYLPFTLDIHEWDATFQVDEEIGFANKATGWGTRPSIPIPTNPDAVTYLGISHRNNPNNS